MGLDLALDDRRENEAHVASSHHAYASHERRCDRDVTCARRPSRRSRRRILRHFMRDREGATAVEFALVALPFLAILFAIIELALNFWVTQVLENAVSDASRRIYTGQFQQENPGQSGGQLATAFREDVCARVPALFDCNSMVHVDVRRLASFPNANPDLPVDNGVFDPSGFTFENPGPDEIVVVRAAMAYPIFVNFIPSQGHRLTGNQRLIMASTAFRSEPFTQ
jgi:Flp pilus assembly protein TadG